MSFTRADYVYITSWGNSGSTLLELLLGRHPDMTSIGEIDRLSLQFARANRVDKPGVCSCGKRPMDCPVWAAVANAVKHSYGADLSEAPFSWRVSSIGSEKDLKWRAPFSLAARAWYRTFRTAEYDNLPGVKWLSFLSLAHRKWVEHRFFAADVIRSLTNAKAVIDASKDRVSMRDVYDYGTGRVKLLFLTRDVRGVVWSRAKRMKTRRTTEPIAKKWVRVNRGILRFLDGVPPHDWMHVKYEELCAQPIETLRRVCGFLGYPYDPAIENLNSFDQHTIGGNRIRFSTIGVIKEDLSWKEQLTSAELEHIHRVSHPMMMRLGYQW